jgi:hypothetical protein
VELAVAAGLESAVKAVSLRGVAQQAEASLVLDALAA